MEQDIILGQIATPGAIFVEARHPQAFWMPRHTHDAAHVALVLEGHIETSVGSREILASPRCAQFVAAGETHTSRYHRDVRVFVATFHPTWWERLGPSRPELGGVFHDDAPTRLAFRLYEEFQRPDDLTPLMLEGLSLELAATIARKGDGGTSEPAPRWLRRVEEALRARPEASYTVSRLAEAVGVHPGHLMREFRRRHGCTIGDFVRRLRVERACRLLADPEDDQTLGQIALAVGFADQSAFGKTFRRATGVTPGEFRAGRRAATPGPKMFD